MGMDSRARRFVPPSDASGSFSASLLFVHLRPFLTPEIPAGHSLEKIPEKRCCVPGYSCSHTDTELPDPHQLVYSAVIGRLHPTQIDTAGYVLTGVVRAVPSYGVGTDGVLFVHQRSYSLSR